MELKAAILVLVKERISDDIRAFVKIGYDKELHFSVTEEVYNSERFVGEYNMTLNWVGGFGDIDDGEEEIKYWGGW